MKSKGRAGARTYVDCIDMRRGCGEIGCVCNLRGMDRHRRRANGHKKIQVEQISAGSEGNLTPRLKDDVRVVGVGDDLEASALCTSQGKQIGQARITDRIGHADADRPVVAVIGMEPSQTLKRELNHAVVRDTKLGVARPEIAENRCIIEGVDAAARVYDG